MSLAMLMRGHSAASLTRCSVVVTSRCWSAGALAHAVLLATTLVAGLYAGHLHTQQGILDGQSQRRLLALQRDIEQSQQLQRLSAARSHELERQIDALNLSLHESQQELSVLRSARARKP